MNVLAAANLGLRFLLELGMLAATAYWGYETGDGDLRWVLAIAAPLAVAVVWGLFVSPKATVDVPRAVALAIEFALFGAAALALAATGQRGLAIAFAAVALVSGTLNAVLGDGRGRATGSAG